MASKLVLLSCSLDKQAGGAPYVRGSRSLLGEIDAALARRLGQARQEILRGIRLGEIRDNLHGKGSRGSRGPNSGLVAGPDFAGDAAGGQYLPACVRYRGRFFQEIPTRTEWSAAWSAEVRTLIVSGLYGFLHPEELVQQYDIHLADEWAREVRQERLVDYWRQLLTDVLLDVAQRSGRKTQIVDLLSERLYQSVVDWPHVRKAGWRVYHRCFAEREWEEALFNSGRFFRHEILTGSGAQRSLEWDRFEGHAYFDPPSERILFERALGDTGEQVVREGDEAVAASLAREVGPMWRSLEPSVRSWVTQADANRKLIRQGRPDAADDCFEFAALIAKALESLVKSDVFQPMQQRAPETIRRAEEERAKRYRTSPVRFETLSIGGLSELAGILAEGATRDPAEFARMAESWPRVAPPDAGTLLRHLSERLRDFNQLAGRKKRHDLVMGEAEFDQARGVAIDILRTWPFRRTS